VIARLAALIANIAGKPDPAVIARELVALAVLASYLTQASVERASRVANAAEAAKFG
jgi:hypothetical protein